MDLQSVMKQLKAWEHPKMRAVNAKHGAGENQFGVNLGKLRGLAGKIKRDHKLVRARSRSPWMRFAHISAWSISLNTRSDASRES